MNPIGISEMLRMGCFCMKQSITIDNRRFYVRSRIAQGGFSVIDLVEDARSRQSFALKRIKCHSKDDEKVAAREIEVMRLFRHRNLVPLEASQIVPVDSYTPTLDITIEVLIVMPFYKCSLQDRLDELRKHNGHIEEGEIWEMFLGVCEAVKVMNSHDPPYAHRDIKPANVMLDHSDTPILMDLGSAAEARVDIKNVGDARALQDQAAERCSMLYRAPELFNVDLRSTIDERTDVWSLGCLLYAMAFLESPFEKAYQKGDSIALAVICRNVTFPQLTSYTRCIEELIDRQMIVNPMERPFVNQVIDLVREMCDVSGEVSGNVV